MNRTHPAKGSLQRWPTVAVAVWLAACAGDDAPSSDVADAAEAADVASAVVHENCFNGVDDDGDLLVDCADTSCRRLDACAVYACPDGDLGDAVGLAVLQSTTADAGNDLVGSCGGGGGDDLALSWTAPDTGAYFIDTRRGSYDTVIYVREGGCDGDELACNDDATEPSALESEVRVDAVAGATYLIVVDGYEVVLGENGDAFVLNITPVSVDAETGYCSDRRDNDGDGAVDCADTDCAGVAACEPLGGLVDVAAGQNHACALDAEGHAWCWGAGADGALGDGTKRTALTPTRVPGTWSRLFAGARQTCALDADASLWCWGDGDYDRLLSGEWRDAAAPVDVGIAGARDVCIGGTHACAVMGSGSVRCWGSNDYGQHATGDTTRTNGEPNLWRGLDDGASLACGAGHTCALDADGIVWCSGLNSRGQLGAGADWNELSARDVQFIDDVVAVDAGTSASCMVRADGTVWCVGANASGQMGDGTTTDRRRVVQVDLDEAAVDVTCGDTHCCARSADGGIWCWGGNHAGQVGVDGGPVLRASRVALPSAAVAVSAGYTFTCAVLDDATARCWGDNGSGQIGNGTRVGADRPTPVLRGSAGSAGVNLP